MNRETMKKDLNDLLEAAKMHEGQIDLLRQNIATEQEKLRATVRQHQAMRVEFVEAELRERGLWWCTSCKQIYPIPQFEFVLIEGREEVSSGQEGSCYGYKDFSTLHHACSLCREKYFDRHGQVGKGGVFFHAFAVQECKAGYHAKKFGQWIELDEEKYRLPAIPSEAAERVVAITCDFPLILEIDYREGKESLKIRPQGIVLPA